MPTASTAEVGVYVCLTRGCQQRNVEVRHEWSADWPLHKRQHRCSDCRKKMLFCAVRRPMPEATKRALQAASERRREKP